MRSIAFQRAILLSIILLSPLLFIGIPLLGGSHLQEFTGKPFDSVPVPYHRHPGRSYIDLNGTWRFRLPGKEEWTTVSVPHTFSQMPGLEDYVGQVQYERDFSVDTVGGHAFLHFLEVRNKARVLVNGNEVGYHGTGYTSFSFDITPFLKVGHNVLSVIAANVLDKDHPPNLIGWTNYGGITREVFIEQTADVYVKSADIDCTVHSPRPSPTAEIVVSAIIDGTDAGDVKASLFSPDGVLISEKSRQNVPSLHEIRFDFPVKKPLLWDIDQGYLYRLELSVTSGSTHDCVEYFPGIREIDIEGTQILLNGRPIYIRGTSRHEDFPGTGCVETQAQMEEDLALIRQAGFNTLRLAHYPYHPAFIDMCDREGVLTIEELPVWNSTASIMNRPAFLENSLIMAEEMVTRDARHPSIIAWGIGNEVEAESPEGRLFLEKLKGRIKQLDPSRPVYTTFRKENDTAAGDISDFLAINVKLGWYVGEVTDLGPLLERWHQAFPAKPIVMTEHSAGTVPAYHSDAFHKWSEEYQAYLLNYYYNILHSKPYIAGDFVWPFFDYRDPAKCLNPIPFFNLKGIMTFEREPKASYALMQALNTGRAPEVDYIKGYENRSRSPLHTRFSYAKILVSCAAVAAVMFYAFGRRSIAFLLLIAVLFSTAGILLREFTLDNALNPAMFEGAINDWLSASLRPLPCIPITLFCTAMIPFSCTLLMISYRSHKEPFTLLGEAAPSLWPAVAMPGAFIWSGAFWLCVGTCVLMLAQNLKRTSDRSFVFIGFSLVMPPLMFSSLFVIFLQYRYEFLTFLLGHIFHGM